MAVMPAMVTRNVLNFNISDSTSNPLDPSVVDLSTGDNDGESDLNTSLCRNP